MEDDKNINEEIKLGHRESSEAPMLLQRRSSMKQHRSSIKDSGVKFNQKNAPKRKITFNSDVDEDIKSPDKKYRDSKTFYSDNVKFI